MANNLGELIQMIAGLSQIQDRRRQLQLSEEQLHQQASQFASTDQEGKFTQALKLIAGSSAKSREGMGALIESLAPQYRQAAQAYLQGQPVDPTVIHAGDVQAGHDAMPQQQLATMQNESATQNATGMNVGQMGGSQLMGALAGGAQQAVTPDMTKGYAQRAATGQTPVEAAVGQQQLATPGTIPFMAQVQAGQAMTIPQAAQNALGQGQLGVARGQLNQAWAQLDTQERHMAAEYGLDKMLKTAQANRASGMAGLTPQEMMDGFGRMSTLLKDINDPRSDAASNDVRKRLLNQLKNTMFPSLGPDLPVAGADGGPSQTSAFQTFLNQYRNGVLGSPGMSSPWPTMGGVK